MENQTIWSRVFDVLNSVFLVTLSIVMLYPLIHVAFASFSDGISLLAHRGILIKPIGFTFEGYKLVFKNPMLVRGYLNTLLIVSTGTTLNLVLTSLAAYALSRTTLLCRRPLTLIIVFTMYFSGGLIPLYITVKSLNLDNTFLALILPSAISTSNFLIMRTSFAAIPESLSESARIDGAQDFTILFKIILPLSKPVIAVMMIYYGVHHWNSWFQAMIFMRERTKFPLQLILREILLQGQTGGMITSGDQNDFAKYAETLKYATIMVATVPILLIYPFLQKYFTKGIMIGAVKG